VQLQLQLHRELHSKFETAKCCNCNKLQMHFNCNSHRLPLQQFTFRNSLFSCFFFICLPNRKTKTKLNGNVKLNAASELGSVFPYIHIYKTPPERAIPFWWDKTNEQYCCWWRQWLDAIMQMSQQHGVLGLAPPVDVDDDDDDHHADAAAIAEKICIPMIHVPPIQWSSE